jgi:hypothetical protein
MNNPRIRNQLHIRKNFLKYSRTEVLLLLLTVCFFIFSSSSLEAAYTVFLKSGKVISGVDQITEEDGKVKILKQGISLTMQQDSIEKIEEYESDGEEGDEAISPPSPSGRELPEYQQFDDKAQQARERSEQRRMRSVKARNNAVTQKLERIEELEEKSKELQWKSREKWSPRKARIARQEKVEIDRELETLRGEKDDLLKGKKELERQIR